MAFRDRITIADIGVYPIRASGGVSPKMALGTMPTRPALLVRIEDTSGCFGWGEVWARPGLELQERSMITLAALTVLGRENELRVHLRGALNLGIPKDKIIEILIHLAHYGGWPVAVSAMRIAKESFESFDKKNA